MTYECACQLLSSQDLCRICPPDRIHASVLPTNVVAAVSFFASLALRFFISSTIQGTAEHVRALLAIGQAERAVARRPAIIDPQVSHTIAISKGSKMGQIKVA